MQVAEAINSYEAYLISKEQSTNTKHNDLAAIKRFIKWSGFETLDDITPDSIIKYKNHLLENKTSGLSINIYMAHLRSFFSYLYEFEHMRKDYSGKCEPFKTKKAKAIRGTRQYKPAEEGVGKSILQKEVIMILKSAGKMREGQRNKLMIEVGLVCGFRASDIIDFRVRDIDFDTGRVRRVLVKTKELVDFDVGKGELLAELKEYIEDNKLSGNDFIFQTAKGTPMTPRNFSGIFENIVTSAGLKAGKRDDGYTTHDLRRTCVTILKDKGVPDRIIQRRIGHSSLAMTVRYDRGEDAEESIEQTRKAIKSAFY